MRNIFGIALLLGALACGPRPEPCTQEALDAKVQSCTMAIIVSPEESKQAVHDNCVQDIEAWKVACR